MDEIGDYNLFVGGLSGIFKGLRVTYLKGIHNIKNLQNIKEINKRNELTVINWGDDEETEILLGYANQQVRIYDVHSKNFVFDKLLQYGGGGICGISKYNGRLLTGIRSGSICVWGSEEFTSPTTVINTKGLLERVRHSCADRNIVAAGGKENDLSLWNLETQQTVFVAKNVRHDDLELRVPVWVSDICFVPDAQKVAVCTRHGHVRLYDPSTQTRRPVVQVEVKDQAFTCIAVAPRDHHVVVGSGTGNMYLVDLRGKGVLLNHYKGFVGGIRQIACTPSEPYIVSVGLDRHIRIHNLDTKQLLHKEYLQSRLSCILAKSSFTMSPNQVDLKQESEFKQEAESVVDIGSDEEYESMFDNMDVIMDGEKRTKKERSSDENKVDDLVKDEKYSETEIFGSFATEKKKKGKRSRQNKTVDNTEISDDNFVEHESDSEAEVVKDVAAKKEKKVKNDRNSKKDQNPDVENNLGKSNSERKILTEVAAEKKKVKSYSINKTDDNMKTVEEINNFQVQDHGIESESDTQMEIVKEVIPERRDCTDREIIEVGQIRSAAKIDNEVETVKVITNQEKRTNVNTRVVESKSIEVIQIDDDEDEHEVESAGYDTDDDDVEDEDSDVVEIYYEGKGERNIEMEVTKEIAGWKSKSAYDWRNQSTHGTDDIEEDEDSDVIEIENDKFEDNFNSSSTGVDVARMEVDTAVTEKEQAEQDGVNEPKCKADDTKEENINVTEGEDNLESSSEEETDKKVVGDKKTKKNRRRRRSKWNQSINNSESRANSGLKEEEDSDKIGKDSEGEEIIRDILSDDSKNSKNIVTERNKNKRRKKENIVEDSNVDNDDDQDNNHRNLQSDNKTNETSNKAENDSQAEKIITDTLSDDSNIKLTKNDNENNDSIMVEKNKNERRKKNESIASSNDDDDNDDDVNKGNNRRNLQRGNKKNETSNRVENDSETEKKLTDMQSGDSNIVVKDNSKISESVMEEKNKNKRKKKNKSVDGSKVDNDDDQDSNHKNLQSDNTMNETSNKVENDSQAEKIITDTLSDDSNIKLCKNDNENNESIMVEKNKNKRRRKNKTMDSLNIDDDINQGNNHRNLRRGNKNNETSNRVENDSETEKKLTDMKSDRSNIRVKDDSKISERIMEEKNKNKRSKKNKSVDGSKMDDDEGNKRRNLRSRNKSIETDDPKAKRRKKNKI